ncbi:hypothetical protein FRC18_009256 [Serendipita sp. 400]|nr:hypothetical protein FRC18_009256 [Serendipita sp. 400]
MSSRTPPISQASGIIPSEDGHLSEYVADSDKRVRYISGFTGSAATAIVSKRSAYLFVDSRYWIQAEQELDGNWTVHKTGTPEIKDWLDWAITCPRGSKIAIDSRMISHERATKLYKGLCERGSKLAHPRQNLVDLIWDDRPQRPKNPVFVQPVEFTGKDIKEKLSDVRRWIRKQNAAIGKDKGVTRHASNASQSKPGATPPKETIKRSNTSPNGASGKLSSTPPPQPPSAVPARMNNPGVKRSNSSPSAAAGPSGADKISAVFVSDLASIAYTLNLRGSDILYNPVFTAYLLIGVEGKTTLFIDKVKVPTEVRDYLHENGVSIREYSDDGEFGVRIESALLVREVVTKRQQDEDMWLGFERLTQAPIQLKMVRASMLTKDERQWIKDHNNNVRKTLEPYLAEDKRALKWLRRECQKGFGNEGKGSAGLSIEWD